MKVLLIQPNYRPQRGTGMWMVNPPLGLGYIAAVLEQNNVHVKILDANALNLQPEDVAKEASTYDIIGISIMTPAHNFAVSVVKQLPKDVLKIAGGPHPTGIPEALLNDGFDVVVRGEGEKTMLEIANGKDLKDVLGISFKNNERIIHNDPRPMLTAKEINELPFPARHLLPSNGVDLPYISAGTKYLPWSPIFTSRGCVFNCYYCNKSIFGRRFVCRSPENVLKELLLLKEKYRVKEIDFYDDNFNSNLGYATRVLDLIIENKLNLHLRFSNGLRVSNITKELLEKMKRAGCGHIAYGVESGNQAVLDRISKGITLDQARNAVKLTKEAKIPVVGFFMIGLLGDTEKTMQDTINFAKELNPDIAQFSITTPYPGTRMWDEIKEKGEILVKNWDDFHHTVGRMVYKHPEAPEPELVKKMYAKAHREYYYRPSYFLKQIAKIRSWEQLKMLLRGAGAVIKITGRKQ